MNYGRIKLITHNDLDGIGCAIVLKSFLPDTHIDLKIVGYDKVDEEVLKALIDKRYDFVFITDISVDQATASIIDKAAPDRVVLIDHHPGRDYLKDYPWTVIVTVEDNRDNWIQCGASLTYLYLKERVCVEHNETLATLVEEIRRWDIWLWQSMNDRLAKELNDYMYIVGIDDFIDEMIERVRNQESELLSDTAKTVLSYKQKEIDAYIEKKNKTIVKRTLSNDDNVGFVYADSHFSELGNRLLSLNPDLDAIIMADLSTGKVHLRSTLECDCSEIAKAWYGGGGHKAASGGTLDENTMKDIQKILFDKYI